MYPFHQRGLVDLAVLVLDDMKTNHIKLTKVTFTSLLCELTKLRRFDIINELSTFPSTSSAVPKKAPSKVGPDATPATYEYLPPTYQQSSRDLASFAFMNRSISAAIGSLEPPDALSHSSSSFSARVSEYEHLKARGISPAPHVYQTLMKSLYSETIQSSHSNDASTTSRSGSAANRTSPSAYLKPFWRNQSSYPSHTSFTYQKPAVKELAASNTTALSLIDAPEPSDLNDDDMMAGWRRREAYKERRKQKHGEELFRLYLVFQEMRDSGVQPDIVAYNMLINACAGAGAIDNALETVQTMQSEGINPDVISYTSLIKACAIRGTPEVVDLAEEIFEAMQQRTNHFSSYIDPTVLTFQRLMQTYVRVMYVPPTDQPAVGINSSHAASLPLNRFTTRIWALYDDMRRRGIVPNVSIYRYCIKAALVDRDVHKALAFVDTIRHSTTVRYDFSSWLVVAKACGELFK